MRPGDGVTITELANSLGTTVRALRHYEDVRILWPDRNGRNARRYGPGSRARAAVVVALRRANVPLKNIESAVTGVMDVEGGQLVRLLEDQLKAAEQQVTEIGRLLDAARAGSLFEGVDRGIEHPGPVEGRFWLAPGDSRAWEFSEP